MVVANFLPTVTCWVKKHVLKLGNSMAASENSFEPFGFCLVLSGLGLDFFQILNASEDTVPAIPHAPQRDFKCQRYPGGHTNTTH